jgi:hypothetical protein
VAGTAPSAGVSTGTGAGAQAQQLLDYLMSP